jgi:hypothetical protein
MSKDPTTLKVFPSPPTLALKQPPNHLIAFPRLHLGQASVQNSARATFSQGGQFIQQEKKEIKKIPCNSSVINVHF